MKNEMLALILAGGQRTRLGRINQKHHETCRFQFGGRYRIAILLSQTVPTQEFTMLVWLHSINHLSPLTAILGNGSQLGAWMESMQVCLFSNAYSAGEGNRWFEETSLFSKASTYPASIGICADSIWGSYLQDRLRWHLQAHKDNNAAWLTPIYKCSFEKETSRLESWITDANNQLSIEKQLNQIYQGFHELHLWLGSSANMLVAAGKSWYIDMSDFGKCHSNTSRIRLKVFMLMNSMVIGRRWYDESLWEANMELYRSE